VRSGQIAAHAIATNTYTQYELLVDEELMPDLLIARQYAMLYRLLPQVCYLSAIHSPRARRTLCKVLRGEYQFRGIRRRLGLLGIIGDLMPAYA
jgi:hypothetical protein